MFSLQNIKREAITQGQPLLHPRVDSLHRTYSYMKMVGVKHSIPLQILRHETSRNRYASKSFKANTRVGTQIISY